VGFVRIRHEGSAPRTRAKRRGPLELINPLRRDGSAAQANRVGERRFLSGTTLKGDQRTAIPEQGYPEGGAPLANSRRIP
jgi:hypothetical protein